MVGATERSAAQAKPAASVDIQESRAVLFTAVTVAVVAHHDAHALLPGLTSSWGTALVACCLLVVPQR